MQVDFEGRIRNINLSRTQGMRPVFEAIVNAIDAISENDNKGGINISIKREESQGFIQSIGDRQEHPIESFEIVDTGTGFREANWRAFQECDTTIKALRGGKGVGRLLFLKAFDRVEVESTFIEHGKWHTRKFTFTVSDGISKEMLIPAQNTSNRTIVRLLGFKEDYRKECPKTAQGISSRVIEHCMAYFIFGTCPRDIHNINGGLTWRGLRDFSRFGGP